MSVIPVLTENANQEAICLDDRDNDGEYIKRSFYFGRIIFGQVLSPFGQISDNNIGHYC